MPTSAQDDLEAAVDAVLEVLAEVTALRARAETAERDLESARGLIARLGDPDALESLNALLAHERARVAGIEAELDAARRVIETNGQLISHEARALKAERALVTETLSAKLSRLIPGAVARRRGSAPPERLWVVERPRAKGADEWDILATEATEREAIDRALFLWGAQR